MDSGLKSEEKIVQLEGLLKSMAAIEEYELCHQIQRVIGRLKTEREIMKLKEIAHLYDVKSRIQKAQQSLNKNR